MNTVPRSLQPSDAAALPETPFLVLDAGRVQANAARMLQRIAAAGISLRPHVKTAKCLEAALMCCGGRPGPITVSTLKEAEQFSQHGFTDILYAVGMVPGKLEHAAKLVRAGVALKLITDSVAGAQAIAGFCRAGGLSLPTLIEIDVDGHRSGVKPEDAERLKAIASALGELYTGVMTHAGGSYGSTNIAEIRQAAVREREGVVLAAATIRGIGLESRIISVGSSPTATYGESFEGITEVRAGVYVFFDLVMAGLQVCTLDDIAMTVACSVIGHRADTGWLITDGGWMAMSRDRGTAKQKVDQGYGLVCDAAGTPMPDVIVSDANQEHGVVSHRLGKPLTEAEFPVGTVLRVMPNHACATAAQFDSYHLVAPEAAGPQGLRLEGEWARFRGW